MKLPIAVEEAILRHNELRDLIAAQVHRDWPLPQRAMPFASAEEREAFLLGFDLGFGEFIRVYRRQERSGRQRWADRFSGANLDGLIRDIGARLRHVRQVRASAVKRGKEGYDG